MKRLLLLAAALSIPTVAQAQQRVVYHQPPQRATHAQPRVGYAVQYAQPAQTRSHAVPAPSDPLAWINAARAARGLRALAYDANLSAWAASNNAAQASRGLGHFVRAPGAAQIAASTSDPGYAVRLWAASPAHAVWLFNPSLTTAGISYLNGYATANLR